MKPRRPYLGASVVRGLEQIRREVPALPRLIQHGMLGAPAKRGKAQGCSALKARDFAKALAYLEDLVAWHRARSKGDRKVSA